MEGIPSVNELLKYIRLWHFEKRIQNLADCWQIRADAGLQGREKLKCIFRKWLEKWGEEATRRNVLIALNHIGETEIFNSYQESILIFEKKKDELSSIFKNVQEENELVKTCVMQCMPLGPPRVGKTCLKKRLLKERLLKGMVSPSTAIAEEKQTVLVDRPSMFTLSAKGTNWERISWDKELLNLIHKFKSAPQKLLNSLRSIDSEKNLSVIILALSISLFIFSMINMLNHLLLLIFAVLSFIEGVMVISDFKYAAAQEYKASKYNHSRSFIASRNIRLAFILQIIIYIICFVTVQTSFLKMSILFCNNFTIFWDITKQKFALKIPLFIENLLSIMNAIMFFLDTTIILFYEASVNQIDIVFTAGLCLLGYESDLFFSGPLVLPSTGVLVYARIVSFIFCFKNYKKFKIGFLFLLITENVTALGAFFSHSNSKAQVMLKALWALSCTAMLYYCFTSVILFQDIWTFLMFFVFNPSKPRVVNPHDYSEASLTIVESAVEKLPDISSIHVHNKNVAESLKIYFTDAGGQPEFQEALPALLSGPTVFFLVFDLSKGFKTNYVVKYIDRTDGLKYQSYKTQFTVINVLLQCLASISCLGGYSEKNGEKTRIKPKVFFIGTHKDLVKKIRLETMEKELKAAVKNTTWYRKNIIQFASNNGNLMFSVNNFDESDSSFSLVRAAIQKLSCSNDYKVQLPASWLGLELALRLEADSVISISECQDIAKEYSSIQSRENLDEALWFLHNNVGSVRYYKQIPELRNVVITKPQVLFTIITNLLVCTFPFSDGKAKVRFREKGCFTRDEVDELGNIRETGLTVTQVIALLCYLHILAPLKVDSRGNREYFLPCALSHAPKPDRNQLQSKGKVAAPPLLISFKCGYTPKGVFSGLVSHMIQKTQAGGLKWSLDEDCIFRDQVTFLIGHTGFCVTITNLIKFLCLEIRKPQSIEGENLNTQPKDHFANDFALIVNSITKGLAIVSTRLNYVCDTDPILGFYCGHDSCVSDEPHPTHLHQDILICSKHASNTAYLSQDQQKWIPKTEIGQSSSKPLINWTMIKQVVNVLLTSRNVFLFVVITCILWAGFHHGQNNFDISQVKEDFLHVKNVQLKYYSTLCHKYPNTLSCKLQAVFQRQKNYNIKPIRLETTHGYNFEDFAFSGRGHECSNFVILASFSSCNPKPCKYPMREIQNGLIRYLNLCSSKLDDKRCWPIANHLIGFEFLIKKIEMYNTKVTVDLDYLMLNKYFLSMYYTIHYQWFGNPDSCTKDIINEIDKKGLSMEDLLTIMRYITYTKPELAPVLILKSIDKAFPVNGSNEAIDDILYHISRETSSIRWVTPIVATASDMNWFRQTKHNGTLLKDYFPVYKKLK